MQLKGSYIAGKWLADVNGPDLDLAIQTASRAGPAGIQASRDFRIAALEAWIAGLKTRRDEVTQAIIREVQKPIRFASAEVDRGLTTLLLALETFKTDASFGAGVSLKIAPPHSATATRQAAGTVLAIAPFNFPLNLVLHKVAPAMAVGAPILLKPPRQGAGVSEILADIYDLFCKTQEGEPDAVKRGMFQVLQASNEKIEALMGDPRIAVLSFTGSDTVGWKLRNLAHRKKVLLELGGNAAVLIDQSANLADAAMRCALGGYSYAGQICISIQRIFVDRSVFSEFMDLFLSEVKKLKVGDPQDDDVVIGPLIDERAVARIEGWIDEAEKAGARVLLRGTRDGRTLGAFVLTQVPEELPLARDEVFGPVVIVEAVDSMDEGVERINSSRFGLQAGIFGADVKALLPLAQKIFVGGVLINEVPTFRSDALPYGGVKDSGMGREGVLYAMQEFTEWKTLIVDHTFE